MIGPLFEKFTKLYNKFSILKLDDLFKFEVNKIVHAHFANILPTKLYKFFTQTKKHLLTYY